MLIEGERFQFNDENIDHAPKSSGVYILYSGQRVLFIGKAIGTSTIRSKLQSHKRGDEGPLTRYATHFTRELASSPANRVNDLLREYKNVYLSLPVANAAIANRYSF
jgi:hypothetical protein